jgi:hypothetical protein
MPITEMNLTSIFGNEITVYRTALQVDREYTGFAGAEGLSCMFLGTRGYGIVVTGILRANGSGSSYQNARSAMADKILDLENWLVSDDRDYKFNNEYFGNVVWEKIDLIPNNRGTLFLFTANKEMIVNFVAYGRSLTGAAW